MRRCSLVLASILCLGLHWCICASPLPALTCNLRGHQQLPCGGLRVDQEQRERGCGYLVKIHNGIGHAEKEGEATPSNCTPETLATQVWSTIPQLGTAENSSPETSKAPLVSADNNPHPSIARPQSSTHGREGEEDSMEVQVLSTPVQNECRMVCELWNRMEDRSRSHLCPSRSTGLATTFAKETGLAFARQHLVGLEPRDATVTEAEESEKGQRIIKGSLKGYGERPSANRRKRGLAAAGALVYASLATTATLCPVQLGNCSFPNDNQYACSTFERTGRTPAIAWAGQNLAQYNRSTAGRSAESPRASRESVKQREHQNLQGIGYEHGSMPQRLGADKFHMGQLQNFVGEIFRRIAWPLGSTPPSVREGSRGLREEEGRSKAAAEGNARENNCANGCRGDLRRAGRSHRRCRAILHECKENARCYEFGIRNSPIGRRCKFAEEENVSNLSGQANTASDGQDSPSLGRTTKLPYLDEWDRPWEPECEDLGKVFRPSRHELHKGRNDAERVWNEMAPCFLHSIHGEKDFKSVLDAQYQGFLLEQQMFEIDYNDETQRFDLGDISSYIHEEDTFTLHYDYKVATLKLNCDCEVNAVISGRDYEADTNNEKFEPEEVLSMQGTDEDTFDFCQHQWFPLQISASDIDTLCMELACDQELLEEDLWPKSPFEHTALRCTSRSNLK